MNELKITGELKHQLEMEVLEKFSLKPKKEAHKQHANIPTKHTKQPQVPD